jgi:putative tryptophan/tyrosine transport system substrate-binding protein
MRDFGYQEGVDIQIEYRWAEGNYQLFPILARELLAERVAVIVTAGTPAVHAVMMATDTVPVVMVAVGNPIGTGIVKSLARLGFNVTGLSSIAPELEGKRLELLKGLLPALSHVAVLWNSENLFHESALQQAREAAHALGVQVLALNVRTAGDLDSAFGTMLEKKPEALLVLADRLFLHDRARLVEFLARMRLPNITAYREIVEAGGLMSYGPSYEDMHRRAAGFVSRILKGAKPGDLPVEQPTKFTFVVNTRTAKALGHTFSRELLARADEVID